MPQYSREEKIEQVKSLTDYVMRKYYCDNDIASIVPFFDTQLSFFGAGEGAYAFGPESVMNFFTGADGIVPSCTIDDAHYDVIEAAPDVFVCTGLMWIATKPETGLYLRVHQRVTAVFRWYDGVGLKCCHAHCSNPYGEMAEGELAFPLEMCKATGDYVQENLKRLKGEVLEKNELLQNIYDTVDCVIVRFLRKGELYKLISINKYGKTICEKAGVHASEFDWTNGMARLVIPADKERLEQSLHQLKTQGDSAAVDFAVIGEDGIEYHLSGKVSFVSESEDGQFIQYMLFDNTERAALENQINYEREVFRLAMESSASVIFEYSAADDTMTIYGSGVNSEFDTKVEGVLNIENFSNKLDTGSFVETSYADLVRENICLGKCQSFDAQVQHGVNENGYNYVWCRINSRKISGNGDSVRIVGSMRNIHKDVLTQKELIAEASIDNLTGLMRRHYAVNKIREYLSDYNCAGFGFMMLDLDNFKQINDVYGHMVGDDVLREASKIIKETFRYTDICARLGGDEVMVFLPDISSADILNERAEIIGARFAEMKARMNINLETGISMGGIYCSRRKSFRTLYNKADSLLYSVKNSGKNSYRIESDPADI